MPLLLVILLIGVFAYFLWRRKTSTLSRNCRWRHSRTEGVWRCAYCGASRDGADAPRFCAMQGDR